METVLIAGASRGIGLALAEQFLEKGYDVIATYRGAAVPANLEKLASSGRLSCLSLNVTDGQSIATLVAKLDGRVLDILINNAGIQGPKQQTLQEMDADGWMETLRVNTIAPFMLSQALLPNLRLSANPRILTVSSQMGALNGQGAGFYAYRSSKAAVNKVMQVLAGELKQEGIIVVPVHPGWVRTDMGGSQADISPRESAAGLFELACRLRTEDSGRFFTWQGTEHAW